ncbi:zinc ribbon domain-containing protein [Paenibacillus sp. D51F]
MNIRFVAEIEGIDTNLNDWSTKLSMWAMFAQWESQQERLFTNVLFCGDCGASMYCIARTWGHIHYACGRYIRTRRLKCSRRSVNEAKLATEVLEKLKRAVYTNIDIDPESACQANIRIASLEDQVMELVTRRNRAQDLFVDGNLDKNAYHEILDRIDKTLSDHQEQILRLRNQTQITGKGLKLQEQLMIENADKLTPELLISFVKRVDVAVDASIQRIDFFF